MEVSINLNDKDIKKAKPSKKKDANKKISWTKILLLLLMASIVGTGIYFVYKGFMVGRDVGFVFTPGQLLDKKKEPELLKDSTGKFTNVLLVGIDTRQDSKLKLLNTDVIIVGSYNHESKDIVMISIPRDFYVKVHPDRTPYKKINSVYATHEKSGVNSGLLALQNIAEDILGMEIQYNAMINFQGFVDLIDAVDGVDVNVENSFTDYRYPKGTGYQTVSFKKGPQTMDGETALKYARSRLSLQNQEGSDFARARRQQRVIDAFMDKLLSTEVLLSPNKLMSLLSSVQENLKVSEFDLDDIQAGINILKSFTTQETNNSTYSFVLDPTIGNNSLVTTSVPFEGYGIGPKEGLGRYTNIKEYVALALKYPLLYSEDPSIYIYNTGMGADLSNNKTKEIKEDFKYLDIRYQGTKYNDKEGEYIYSNKTDEYMKSVTFLSQYLKIENNLKPEYLKTDTGGDISILLGKQVVNVEVDTEQ